MAKFLDVLATNTGFCGRARRREFWPFFLCCSVVGVPFVALDIKLGWSDPELGIGPLTGLYILLLFLPNTALMVRRLHDSDRSGWWVLLGALPFIGFITLLVFMLAEGTAGPNQYGEDPLGRESDPADDGTVEEGFVPKLNKDE